MTIVNGIDGSKYDIAIDKGKKRKELGLKETGPIIGACVRLTEQKGISYLLEAVQRIKPHFPDISVVIAGEGPARANAGSTGQGQRDRPKCLFHRTEAGCSRNLKIIGHICITFRLGRASDDTP